MLHPHDTPKEDLELILLREKIKLVVLLHTVIQASVAAFGLAFLVYGLGWLITAL